MSTTLVGGIWGLRSAQAHEQRLQSATDAEGARLLLCCFCARIDGVLAGTTTLTMGRGPAGVRFGSCSVATASEFCSQGIAAMLVSLARDDFARLGGHLLSLAIVNPAAAMIYRMAGLSRLCACDAWSVHVLGG